VIFRGILSAGRASCGVGGGCGGVARVARELAVYERAPLRGPVAPAGVASADRGGPLAFCGCVEYGRQGPLRRSAASIVDNQEDKKE
jgi:hypothetical protein